MYMHSKDGARHGCGHNIWRHNQAAGVSRVHDCRGLKPQRVKLKRTGKDVHAARCTMAERQREESRTLSA